VEKVFQIKASQDSIDMATWGYFRKMLQKLSIEGMSDEEIGVETISNRTMSVYHVKLCVWRTKAISDYLRVIDGAGDTPGICSVTGPKTAPRIKTTAPGQSKVPAGLPKNMYDTKWLEEQERDRPFYVEDELHISEEVFKLLVLATDSL
jgi:hypothetical protein